MTNVKKVWFVTGASRGLGAEITRAALEAGHCVVAAVRRPETVGSLPTSPDLLVTRLDVTRREEAESAVDAALQRFGRIDVLVNNAGYGVFGYFEELTPTQIERQFATNVYGLMNVTRAVLPHLRAQRSGHLITISSVSGLVGGAGRSAYHASKFAVEGFMESLYGEVSPFGIATTLVEPGYLRTEFLDGTSIVYGDLQVDDYAEASTALRTSQEAMVGIQEGDPVKLAQLLVGFAEAEAPPRHFVAGTDAYELADADLRSRARELAAWRHLSTSIGYGEVEKDGDPASTAAI